MTPLQELQEAVSLYNDSLDQCLIVDMDYIDDEIRYLKLEWEGMLAPYDPDEPTPYHHFNLQEEIRQMKEDNDWTTWKR